MIVLKVYIIEGTHTSLLARCINEQNNKKMRLNKKVPVVFKETFHSCKLRVWFILQNLSSVGRRIRVKITSTKEWKRQRILIFHFNNISFVVLFLSLHFLAPETRFIWDLLKCHWNRTGNGEGGEGAILGRHLWELECISSASDKTRAKSPEGDGQADRVG